MTKFLKEEPHDTVFVWRAFDDVRVQFSDVGEQTAEFILTAEETLLFGQMLINIGQEAIEALNGED